MTKTCNKTSSNEMTERSLRSKRSSISFKHTPSQTISKQSSNDCIKSKHVTNGKSQTKSEARAFAKSNASTQKSAIKHEVKPETKPKAESNIKKSSNSNSDSIDKKSSPKQSNKKDIKIKENKKTSKMVVKEEKDFTKNGSISPPRRRGLRIAGLNAMFKVHLLYESQRKKGTEEEDENLPASLPSNSEVIRNPKREPTASPSSKIKVKKVIKKEAKKKVKNQNKKDQKKNVKAVCKKEPNKTKDESKGKELVLVDQKTKQLKPVRKRRIVDDDVEIIDTRYCKRMASLNASAIMAASYLPERAFKRSRSIESSRSVGSTVEMIQETKISSSISRVEVPPTATIHTCHETNHVVVKSAKTIETVKKVRRMSGKIRDRLVAIEMMERENDRGKKISSSELLNHTPTTSLNSVIKRTSQTRRKVKTSRTDQNHLTHPLQSEEATGLRTTEYQVTKVQINTGKGTHMKREKMAHQIETILEKDAVVREYQFQTKATSQSYRIHLESSSFNEPVTTNIINSNTVHALPCLPIHTPGLSDLHLSTGPNVIQSSQIIANQGLNHAACFTHPSQPVLQIACNPPYRQLQSASATINPLPVLNLAPQYPSHYASAFSVPHYSSPTASINYSTDAYSFYPAGSIIQPMSDPYIRAYPLQKPIPFHAAPIVHRSDQNFSDFTSANLSGQFSVALQPQSSPSQQSTLIQQPQPSTLINPVPPHLSRPNQTTIQMEALRPRIETNSFISFHRPVDISHAYSLAHDGSKSGLILPADVARCTPITNFATNHPVMNQEIPIDSSNTIGSTLRPPSVTFLGTSTLNSLFSKKPNSAVFQNVTNGSREGVCSATDPSLIAGGKSTSQKRSPSTVITEIFPIKKSTESKKTNTETHVSITPLVVCDSVSSRVYKDSLSQIRTNAVNHKTGSSVTTVHPVTGEKQASAPTSASRTESSSTGCHIVKSSPNSVVVTSQLQKPPKKHDSVALNSNKKTASVKLKRPPTLCNVSSQKKIPTISCVQLNCSQQPKKRSPNPPKTKIDIVPVENRISPNQESGTNIKKPGKKRLSHGWSWEGKPKKELVYVKADDQPQLRECYPAICHLQGDVIRVRDCVLLRSGPRATDLHFVAKIGALWEEPETGEMMMSLLWYYRPEHTEPGRKPSQMPDEIFASKHRDVNSVACIDDKCYVLTYNEYCRYRKKLKMKTEDVRKTLVDTIVPQSKETYYRKNRLPNGQVCPDRVFCCRKVYDFRLKRTLKNPI